MILHTLHIRSFGKFKDMTVRLTPGINLIEGANESGKSTAARFVRYMLYGFDRAGRNAADASTAGEKARAMPFDETACRGSVTLTEHSSMCTVRRETVGGKGHLAVTSPDGKELYAGRVPGEAILGVSAQVYDRTALVFAGDILFKDAKSLLEAIQNTVFSADSAVDTASAMKKLDAYRRAILGKTGKSGRLYEARERYADLNERRNEAFARRTQLRAVESSLNAARTKLDEHRAAVKALSAKLSDVEAKKAYELLREWEAAEQTLREAEKKRDEKRVAMSLDGFMPSKAFLAELTRSVGTIEHLDSELLSARREFGSAESSLKAMFRDTDQLLFNERLRESGMEPEELQFELKRLREEEKMMVKRAIWLACLIVTIPIALIVLAKRKKVSAAIRSYVEKLGCTDADQLASHLEGVTRAEEMLSVAKTRCAAAKEALETLMNKRYEEARKLSHMLEKSGVTVRSEDTGDIVDTANEQIRLLQREIELLDTLSGDVNVASARCEAIAAVAPDRAALEAKAAAYHIGEEPGDETAVRRELDYYSKASESLQTRIAELEKKAAAIQAGMADIDKLNAELDTLSETIARLQLQNDALTLASDTLQAASSEIRSRLSPILTSRASELFCRVTDGVYEGLYMRDDLSLCFKKAGDDAARDAAYLSTGALDAAYLCVRLSLIEQLYDEKPVLIFDEAFSHLDDERLARICTILKAFSETYQILIMTCHSREEKLFGDSANVIRL